MTFSPLIGGTLPHHNKHRGKGPVNRIVVHHWAGTSGGDAHLANPNSDVSATYVLYSDGTLKGQVPEEFRPWTTGPTGDAGSVTVETQNSSGAPNWGIDARAQEKLAQLMADLSNRYGWGELKRGTNVRVHQDFASTACPGPSMLAALPNIIARANQLRAGAVAPTTLKVGDHIEIDDWWNYKSAADAAALRNPVRVMAPGVYEITKLVGGTPHLKAVNGKNSGWVHGSVLNGRSPVAGTARTHTVAKGDTLWGIAKKYGTTVAAIQKANGISGSLIKPGQVLKV